MTCIVILAGTYRQGRQYCESQGIRMQDCIIPTQREQVMGLEIADIRRVGTWSKLPLDLLDEVECRLRLKT